MNSIRGRCCGLSGYVKQVFALLECNFIGDEGIFILFISIDVRAHSIWDSYSVLKLLVGVQCLGWGQSHHNGWCISQHVRWKVLMRVGCHIPMSLLYPCCCVILCRTFLTHPLCSCIFRWIVGLVHGLDGYLGMELWIDLFSEYILGWFCILNCVQNMLFVSIFFLL